MVMGVEVVTMGGVCTSGCWGNELFLISKTCSGHISLVLLPHFPDFREIHGVVWHLAFLVPVPKLWH
ncbi:hypothetical protein TIFTF001_004167 [Ficus carica]|uniref:Uncharacterized protein n=1 Tax=Ficus carica TaxID=3494 RepID=A0AA87ZUD5_FICCA|nr:hypothetical protein TIFTF001_004167 [Ficus carica]